MASWLSEKGTESRHEGRIHMGCSISHGHQRACIVTGARQIDTLYIEHSLRHQEVASKSEKTS